MCFKIMPGLADQAERVGIPEIEELAFIRRINASDDFRARLLVAATRALMKEPVDHNLVSLDGEFAEPGSETGIVQRAALAVVIWDNQKRADMDRVTREFGKDLLHLRSGRRRDIMDRDDERTLHGVASPGQ